MTLASHSTAANEWTRVAGDQPLRWPLCALVVGDRQCAELAAVAAALADRTHALFVADLEAALSLLLAESLWPDCVVLLENRPGELLRGPMDALRAAAPLARWICVLGSWCEGEFRSGEPWPGATRVYWHQFSDWFQQELAAAQRGDCPATFLPITATSEEGLLQAYVGTSTAVITANNRTTVIFSARREMAEMLADVCRGAGCKPVLLPLPAAEGIDESHAEMRAAENRNSDFAAAIWDFATTDAEEVVRFAAAVEQFPVAQWFALAGFPRDDFIEALERLGEIEIFSKPLRVDPLQSALTKVAAKDA